MGRSEAQSKATHTKKGNEELASNLRIASEVGSVAEALLLEPRYRMQYAPEIVPMVEVLDVQQSADSVVSPLFVLY